MNNVWIANSIYDIVLSGITSVVDVQDQKEIASYLVKDLKNRFEI